MDRILCTKYKTIIVHKNLIVMYKVYRESLSLMIYSAWILIKGAIIIHNTNSMRS